MVKHLYFNPCNFEQLILNGIMIELFKSDVQVHPINTDSDSIRFVHGLYQVEDNRQAILRYANSICKKHIFGHNSRQQAIIKMINGVSNDIERQMKTDGYSYDSIQQKVNYLNDFWFSASSQWLRRQFYQCHMTLLNLSFVLQETHPQLLIKYRMFVTLRKMFLEEGIVSKETLIAMFANQHNKYKEFDLYPEDENTQVEKPEIHEKVKTESTQEQVEQQLVGKIQQLRETIEQTDNNQQSSMEEHVYSSQPHILTQNLTQPLEVYHDNQVIHSHEVVHQSHQPQQQQSSTFQVTEQLTRFAPQPIEHQVKTQFTAQIPLKSQVHEKKHEVITDEHKMINSDENKHIDNKHTHEHDNVLIQKEIIETLVQTVQNFEEEGNIKTDKHQQHNIDIKKSLKESFSQFVAKPLEYSTRSLAENEEEKVQKKDHVQIDDIQLQKNNEKQNVLQTDQHKEQEKQQTIQLSKDAALVQQAQSEKYVSQENFAQPQPQPKPQPQQHGTIPEQQQKQPEHLSQNKAPQSQTNQSSRPQSQMTKNKIKPKQQSVPRSTQSCKCSIY